MVTHKELLPFLVLYWASTPAHAGIKFQNHGRQPLRSFRKTSTRPEVKTTMLCSIICVQENRNYEDGSDMCQAFMFDEAQEICHLGVWYKRYEGTVGEEETALDVMVLPSDYPDFYAVHNQPGEEGNYSIVNVVGSKGQVCNEGFLPPLPGPYRYAAQVVYKGYQIFHLGGGLSSYANRKKKVLSLDLRIKPWAWITKEDMLKERSRFGAATYGKYIYTFGGSIGTGLETFVRRIDRYDIDGDTWTQLDALIGKNDELDVIQVDNKLWIFQLNLIQIFDFNTETIVTTYDQTHSSYILGDYLFNFFIHPTKDKTYIMRTVQSNCNLRYFDTSDPASGWQTITGFLPYCSIASKGYYLSLTFGMDRTLVVADKSKERWWLNWDRRELVPLGVDLDWETRKWSPVDENGIDGVWLEGESCD